MASSSEISLDEHPLLLARQVQAMVFGSSPHASAELKQARMAMVEAAVEAALRPGPDSEKALADASIQAASLGEGLDFASLHATAATIALPCARWLANGGSFEAFEENRRQTQRDFAAVGADDFPRPLTAMGAGEMKAYEGMRGKMLRDGAWAKALCDGPLAGQSPSAVAWLERGHQWSMRDDSPASQAIERRSRQAFVEMLRVKKDPWARKARLLVSQAVAAPMKIATLIAQRERESEEAAQRIARRYGFSTVVVEGAHSERSLAAQLLATETALAGACERLGIADVEMGRRGQACLILAARRLNAEGFAGTCDMESGDIAVNDTPSASLLAHEWAHALDGRLGQKMGSSICATKLAFEVDRDHPILGAARELAEAARGSPTPPEWAQAEERRLGRLAAGRLAAQALGRHAWAAMGQESRESYLSEASTPALAIACYQAKRVDLVRGGLLQPEDARAAWERSAQKAVDGAAHGSLGKGANACAAALARHFQVDSQKGLALAMEMGSEKGQPLGQMVLETGTPVLDGELRARIIARPRSAYDALCAGLDASTLNANLEPGYWSTPWEMVARAVERHTARGVFGVAFRLASCAMTPSSKDQAERFKKSWERCLDLAEVQKRPGGMRLTSAVPQALLSCLSSLTAPLSAGVKALADVASRAKARRAGAQLAPSNPKAPTPT